MAVHPRGLAWAGRQEREEKFKSADVALLELAQSSNPCGKLVLVATVRREGRLPSWRALRSALGTDRDMRHDGTIISKYSNTWRFLRFIPVFFTYSIARGFMYVLSGVGIVDTLSAVHRARSLHEGPCVAD